MQKPFTQLQQTSEVVDYFDKMHNDLLDQTSMTDSLLAVQKYLEVDLWIVEAERKMDDQSLLGGTTAVDSTMVDIRPVMVLAFVKLVTALDGGLEIKIFWDLADHRNFGISFDSFLKFELQFQHFLCFYIKSKINKISVKLNNSNAVLK